MDFSVHQPMGSCNLRMSGNNFVDAVEKNFDSHIAKAALGLGNPAGYRLHKVVAEYKLGILGGKGGIEITIDHSGLDLAHEPASPNIYRSKVWVYGSSNDLPSDPYEFEIRDNS
jgi:hypothetical protein